MHIYIYFTFALSAACVRGPEENIEPHFFFSTGFLMNVELKKKTKNS